MTALLAVTSVLAAVSTDDWRYIGGAYVVVVGVIAAYAAWVIRRSRKVGAQLPPDERRWM